MLLELFVLYQIVVIVVFGVAFFTHNELLWAVSVIISSILMFSAWSVEVNTYEYNATILAYSPVVVTYNYPYLTGINLIFFGLGVILMMFDLFDKYGSKIAAKQ